MSWPHRMRECKSPCDSFEKIQFAENINSHICVNSCVTPSYFVAKFGWAFPCKTQIPLFSDLFKNTRAKIHVQYIVLYMYDMAYNVPSQSNCDELVGLDLEQINLKQFQDFNCLSFHDRSRPAPYQNWLG